MNNKTLLKQLLLIPVMIFTAITSYSQLISESFNSATFPPAGWTNVNISGISANSGNVFAYSTASTQTSPVTNPHSGTGMALWDCYNFDPGDVAELVTPSLDFSTGGSFRVKFWMFRDQRYSLNNDSLEVYVNTTQTSAAGTKLGCIYRHYQDAPVESAVGWYQYTFTIPGSFNSTNNYIAFVGISDFGTEMLIDDVVVESAPLTCTGTPTAGVISGPTSVCSGNGFNLVNVGATEGAGMSYAWQSSASSSGPWSNIPGQTNFTGASVTQSGDTYYRFVDTCLNSGQSDISNVLFITMNPQSQCYCQPPSTTLHSFVNDLISNVTIAGTTLNSSNGTDLNTGYTQVSPTPASNTADLLQVNNYTITATIDGSLTSQVSVWIDFNANGTFDTNEYTDLTIDGSGTTASGTIAIPSDAVVGLTGMRLRARGALFTSADACATFLSGETEDYVITISQNNAVNGGLVDMIVPNASCNASNNVIVKLRNNGNVNIAAGAATVALYVTGANPQGPLTQSNSTLLAPGDTATLTFTCSFPNEGLNIDSAFIQTLAGDNVTTDDSLVTGHITLPAAVNAPYAEDFEGPVSGWTVSQLAGSGNWGLASSVDYPDYSPAITLSPKSGSTVALFDSYNFTAGTVSRLATNCINIPADANNGCGYVAGFYFTQDPQYLTLRDSVVVLASADGGNTFSRLGVVKRADSSMTTNNAYTATSGSPEWRLFTYDVGSYAGQTLQFALDAYGNFGNQMAIDSFFVGPKSVGGNVALSGGNENGATLTPSLTACDDGSGWTYYSDLNNSSRYLFGIQWDPSGTGTNVAAKAQATAKVQVDRIWYAAENPAQLMATYTMQRYWDVDLNGATLTGPVNVRFFYSQREMDSIIAAKDNFIAANPGAVDEGFRWFKTVSGAFVPSPSSVNYDSVVNDLELQDVNTGGATINGVLYAQFNGITSFSGGTAASGAGPTTPLPVGLLSFTAQRSGRVNKLSWTTSQEINTSHFVIERSTDGRNFTSIGEVAATGNSSTNTEYSFMDYTPVRGINFYRLRIIDHAGQLKFSAVRNVRNEGTADIAIYPNPVSDRMLVNITSDRLDKANIVISDMNGKLLYMQSMNITEGMNYLSVNTSNFSKGTYVIKIVLNDDMVVRKFNRL